MLSMHCVGRTILVKAWWYFGSLCGALDHSHIYSKMWSTLCGVTPTVESMENAVITGIFACLNSPRIWLTVNKLLKIFMIILNSHKVI